MPARAAGKAVRAAWYACAHLLPGGMPPADTNTTMSAREGA